MDFKGLILCIGINLLTLTSKITDLKVLKQPIIEVINSTQAKLTNQVVT
jgi:hypothetical protein